MNSLEALKKYFGYNSFRSGQEEIINSILEGKSVLAVLPTGAGKSICYQIPAIISTSFSLVISPLIALMKDQVDSLNKIEPIAAFINSTLDYPATEKVLQTITSGQIKILYVSPEKLISRSFSERIKSLSPKFIFVDEAHCISEWGHSFRPSYRKIIDFIEFAGVKSVSAFTATATTEVQADIINQLGLSNPDVFVRGFERENLSLNVFRSLNKKEKVLEILKTHKQPAIIYTATRKNAEELAEYLRSSNIKSVYYHAGLSSELKRMIQDDFMNDKVKVICATNAFGMGIDKSDIRTVIHYNMPGTIENYYQEIGRAGRDGKDSGIFLLHDDRDLVIQKYFISSSLPTRKHFEEVYNLIADYGKIALGMINTKPIPFDLPLQELFLKKKLSQNIIEVSLKILDDSGYLAKKSNLENNHSVKFPLSPTRLHSFIKNFSSADHKDLLVLLAREYRTTIFSTLTKINISRIADLLEEPESDVIKNLSALSLGGIIVYDAPSTFTQVMLKSPRIVAFALKLDLEKLSLLNQNMHGKLDKMVYYTSTNKCRMGFILEYFGQKSPNYKCGKCDICVGNIPHTSASLEYLHELMLRTLHESKSPFKKKNFLQVLTGDSDLASLRNYSTFGTCTHFKKKELEEGIDQLVQKKMIILKSDTIAITEKGIEFFTNDEVADESQVDYEEELHLFNLLRQARKEASEKYGQLQHLICTDDLLTKIAKAKPRTHSELLSIDGFSQRMFNKVGEEFLVIINSLLEGINEEETGNVIPAASKKIADLVKRKYSLEDISKIVKMPESLLVFQIEGIIKMDPDIDISGMVTKKEQNLIRAKIEEGLTDIKILKEFFGNKISYSKLRLVLAKKTT